MHTPTLEEYRSPPSKIYKSRKEFRFKDCVVHLSRAQLSGRVNEHNEIYIIWGNLEWGLMYDDDFQTKYEVLSRAREAFKKSRSK